MEASAWNRIERLFSAALDQPEDARQQFIARECGEDTALARELGELLSAHVQAQEFLTHLDMTRAAVLLDAKPASDSMPPMVGPFRPLKELGRGGMGVVYLAERADGEFQQQVALKLIRQGWDDPVLRNRFLMERQILARLQHVHIARLFDGGVSEDGRVWFAMEYVAGESILAYCDRQAMDIPARLRLFMQACLAVDYAHRNLIIHRDIKPGNMIVNHEGELKLLDFGIAKLLDAQPQQAENEPLTRTGEMVCTPAYCAPEQLRGGAVTTASDVYALGAVLYELLCGVRMPRLDPQRAAKLPSACANASTALARGDSESGMRRELRGDLDTIVMRAVHAEPDRRYASALALHEELRRYLAGEPIVARRDHPGYRARKFLARHRWGVAAAAALLFSLLGGIVATSWQAQRAERSADQAQATSAFLQNMLSATWPERGMGRNVRVVEVLDNAAAQLDAKTGRLIEKPNTLAELRATVGRSYRSLGQYDQARVQLEKAVALYRGLPPSERGELYPRALRETAILYARQDDYAAALPLFEEAYRNLQQSLGLRERITRMLLNDLANALFRLDRADEAERLYTQYLSYLGGMPSVPLQELQAVQGNLGRLYASREQWQKAEPLLLASTEGTAERLGASHPASLALSSNLAYFYVIQQRYGESEPILRRLLPLQEEALGATHHYTLLSRAHLAHVLTHTGRVEQGVEMQASAFTHLLQALGPDHPDTKWSAAELIAWYEMQGRSEEIEAIYEQLSSE